MKPKICPKCGKRARKRGTFGQNVVYECKCGFVFREKGER